MKETGDTKGLITDAASRLLDALPELPSIDFKNDAEIAIYLIHHGSEPEDYEILCDFDLFISETQKGLFVRPKLKVWAGRNDFDRYEFSRNLRAAFTHQFDIVRQDLLSPKKRGWFSGSISALSIGALIFELSASAISSLLLALATGVGRALISDISEALKSSALSQVLKGRSVRAKLEDKITEKQEIVDEGLARMDVVLHRDLYTYAYQCQEPGSMAGIDFKAWPLPFFVTQRFRS